LIWQIASRGTHNLPLLGTRGLNASISEGLAIESEQFARMAATHDTREALDAWLARRSPSTLRSDVMELPQG